MTCLRRLAALLPLCGLCLCLAACADFPEVDAAAAKRIKGDRPAQSIIPIDGIRAQAATFAITDADTPALQAQSEALYSRAVALQGPVGNPGIVAAARAGNDANRPGVADDPATDTAAENATAGAVVDAATTDLQARAAALQKRGAALQGPVGDPATVARLTERAACRAADPACVASPPATR